MNSTLTKNFVSLFWYFHDIIDYLLHWMCYLCFVPIFFIISWEFLHRCVKMYFFAIRWLDCNWSHLLFQLLPYGEKIEISSVTKFSPVFSDSTLSILYQNENGSTTPLLQSVTFISISYCNKTDQKLFKM